MPPIIAILLALLTKEVNLSLFAGCALGALLVAEFHPWLAFDTLFNTMINSVDFSILMFMILLGMIVMLMQESGGTRAYGEWAAKNLKSKRATLVATSLLGALIFLLLYGVRVLDPTSVDWILNNPSPDPAQHYLGWELFRRSPVHLPYIGANYNAVYPFRTSVLFTDSLPLAALLFKLLGGILPTRFQYFGWWGLFCYMMQGGLAQAVIARIAACSPYLAVATRARPPSPSS